MKTAKAKALQTSAQSFIKTAQGVIEISCNDSQLLSIYFIDKEPGKRPHPENAISQEASNQLRAYLNKERDSFDLPLGATGTEFQKQVWQALCDIPYGETRSYGDIARAIGNPKAVRAVGAANGKNPISIVVPCHRVIGANGRLTGYAGGLSRKEWLLELERHC